MYIFLTHLVKRVYKNRTCLYIFLPAPVRSSYTCFATFLLGHFPTSLLTDHCVRIDFTSALICVLVFCYYKQSCRINTHCFVVLLRLLTASHELSLLLEIASIISPNTSLPLLQLLNHLVCSGLG